MKLYIIYILLFYKPFRNVFRKYNFNNKLNVIVIIKLNLMFKHNQQNSQESLKSIKNLISLKMQLINVV